jgi:hypothetical protein
MRHLAMLFVLLALVAFVVGTYAAFAGTMIAGKFPVTYWRGAVGLLLFAISFLLLEHRPGKG